MPEPEKENPYWQRIMEATFIDSLQDYFQTGLSEKFYWFLKAFALEIKALNKPEHPPLINEARFKEICLKTLPHAHYIDHAALNVGTKRLEKITELALAEDFIPTDYFLPDNEKTFLISMAFGSLKQNLYFTINEGLDGWTSQTSKRIKEFQKLIFGLFKFSSIPIPEVRIRSNPNTHEEFLIFKADTAEPLFIKIDDNANSPSFFIESVNQRGEFLSHYSLDTTRIINTALEPNQNTPATIETFFKMLKEKDLLPLASAKVLAGTAGRTTDERHSVKQFFAKELKYGWFPRFIERIGPNAKRGLFAETTAP